MNLLNKIRKKDVTISVIGLGYVGLPLAVEFAKAGFRVIGLDTDPTRLNNFKKGLSYIEDVPSKILKQLIKQKRISATDSFNVLTNVEAIIICVPTPLRKTKDPDVSFVLSAVTQIAKYMDGPQLVVLESTTYPGTTDELILPILEQGGKKAGKDFFLAYSPERVDPGNKVYTTEKIPKVIGGITPNCLKLITVLYSQVFRKVVPVSNTRVAETVKLLENTFRTVNIALVDEIAMMCHKMGIDVWEVIKGASTKPFGYMPFYPGPGVGGACLPKDPLYLSWKAKHYDFTSRFIELASDITTSMPEYVVEKTRELLELRSKKQLKDSKVLVLGVAYKNDLGDTRDSPALEIIRLLNETGASVKYNDPYVPEIMIDSRKYESVCLSNKNLGDADIVIITTAHKKYSLKNIIKNSRLIFDTRGATWAIDGGDDKVVRL